MSELKAALQQEWEHALNQLTADPDFDLMSPAQRFRRVASAWRSKLSVLMDEVEAESDLRSSAVDEIQNHETLPPPQRT